MSRSSKLVDDFLASFYSKLSQVCKILMFPSLQVINASKDAAASSSQLVTCIKLLGPTMHSPLCQQQLMEAAKVDQTAQIIVAHLTSLNILLCLHRSIRKVNNTSTNHIMTSPTQHSIPQTSALLLSTNCILQYLARD